MINNPIGIFDSGIGGLSIFKAIHKLLPKENIIYLADENNFPYGDKSVSNLKKIALKNAQFLIEKNCKLIVVACNTLTVNAIKRLRSKFSVPFVGIEPAVKPAAAITDNNSILVLSSPKATESNKLKSLIHDYASDVNVYNLGCLGLVNAIESESGVEQALKDCIPGDIRNKVDTVVLGCTHFGLVEKEIGDFFGSNVKLIDPGLAVAKQVKRILTQEKDVGLNSKKQEKSTVLFYNTLRQVKKMGYDFKKVNI